MSEGGVLWSCILVAVLGLLAFVAIVLFGLLLTRQVIWRKNNHMDLVDLLFRHGPPERLWRDQLPRYLSDAYTEYLQRRNEFWTTYGQVVLATLIIVVLSILLLTKTISAEAGLPILSGVSGFAIAKGVAAGRTVSSGPSDKEQ